MANLPSQTRDQVNWVQSLGPHGLKDFFVHVDHASGSLGLPHLICVEGMMKQGIIVYLLGGGEPPAGVKPGAHYQGLSRPDGPLEVVVSQAGSLDLDDAWHYLLDLGCETIHLLVTRAEQDRLRPLYPLVRLTGVDRAGQDPSGACRKQRRGLH